MQGMSGNTQKCAQRFQSHARREAMVRAHYSMECMVSMAMYGMYGMYGMHGVQAMYGMYGTNGI